MTSATRWPASTGRSTPTTSASSASWRRAPAVFSRPEIARSASAPPPRLNCYDCDRPGDEPPEPGEQPPSSGRQLDGRARWWICAALRGELAYWALDAIPTPDRWDAERAGVARDHGDAMFWLLAHAVLGNRDEFADAARLSRGNPSRLVHALRSFLDDRPDFVDRHGECGAGSTTWPPRRAEPALNCPGAARPPARSHHPRGRALRDLSDRRRRELSVTAEPFAHLHFVTGGRGALITAGRTSPIERCNLAVVPANQAHRIDAAAPLVIACGRAVARYGDAVGLFDQLTGPLIVRSATHPSRAAVRPAGRRANRGAPRLAPDDPAVHGAVLDPLVPPPVRLGRVPAALARRARRPPAGPGDRRRGSPTPERRTRSSRSPGSPGSRGRCSPAGSPRRSRRLRRVRQAGPAAPGCGASENHRHAGQGDRRPGRLRQPQPLFSRVQERARPRPGELPSRVAGLEHRPG